ncbi:hypothetical protein TorRG33x02_218950 [Trema orientale]|uniref:Uncharacterized protein n=1 Tax=Trema orientale TaxID=63057 RepID=A0A2P5E9Q7_TREOI|nr:hypothetical protein TorRG33x02_218950 [Trema orientale]
MAASKSTTEASSIECLDPLSSAASASISKPTSLTTGLTSGEPSSSKPASGFDSFPVLDFLATESGSSDSLARFGFGFGLPSLRVSFSGTKSAASLIANCYQPRSQAKFYQKGKVDLCLVAEEEEKKKEKRKKKKEKKQEKGWVFYRNSCTRERDSEATSESCTRSTHLS